MDRDAEPRETPPVSRLSARISVQAALWGVVTASVTAAQVARWLDPERSLAAANDLVLDLVEATAPLLPALLLAPLCWWGGRRRRRLKPRDLSTEPFRGTRWQAAAVSVMAGALACVGSALFSRYFQGAPPAFHDEYSYVFQAETLLHGRLSFPSFPEMPELFDQMHVLNEGRFASRYYPGTGLWIAPFLVAGNPWWGHWLANGLVAAGMVWIGRELSGLAVGALAGGLCAVSPALIIFSNLLLAHLPTMAGLTLFLWAIIVCRTRPTCLLAATAGIGLGAAMLCRPMTAAGFALPFGIDWIIRSLKGAAGRGRSRSLTSGSRIIAPTGLQTLCLGIPLLAGGSVMLACNHAITGEFFRSPYQQYTDLYTPRHAFGFHNVQRAEAHLGPKVIDNYDRWAVDLTPQLAVQNVIARLDASVNNTLGGIVMVLALPILLLEWRWLSGSWKLVAASIATLHLVHVPYWFEGIMRWHYVFETAPMWILLFAEATRRLFVVWDQWDAPRMKVWWLTLLAMTVLVNDVTIPPLWRSRLDHARLEIAFPRRHYAQFRAQAGSLAAAGPILVFVVPDPTDRHIDYVSNPPSLSGPVLVAREIPGTTDVARAIRLFPARHPYRFRPATGEWTDLAESAPRN